jgi:hypothetical protein
MNLIFPVFRPLQKNYFIMDVITIESQAYKELMAKINTITQFVKACQERENGETTDGWVDSYEVCTFLKISVRTLQRLRAKGEINYSRISGKNFYRISEIQRLLNERLIRSTEECLQDLINNHKLHAEQRRDIKADK